MTIGLSVLILALLAALPPLVLRANQRFGSLLLAAVPLGLFAWFASKLGSVAEGTVFTEQIVWLADLDVSMSFRLDGLSLAFAMLITGVGGLVLLYASSYMAQHPRRGVFCSTLIGFMAAMLGLVLADNLILLFIFWELTSITSFLLIGFDFHRDAARKSALQALLVTGSGGLALLGGVVMLGVAAGTFEIGDLLAMDRAAIHEHSLYTPIAVLVLLGCFAKSAIIPLHFWLPNAMEAPSPVSALLHSATMVKAGVYLIARMHPVLGGTPFWDETITIAGGLTMLVAAIMATYQTKLKRVLAYSTVSSLGTLVMLIGMGATKAAATYLLAHAMFKGCLFLVAGSITKQTGEKDPEKLGGLLKQMPMTAGAAMLGALSMAGMFPLIGFVGKELMLKAGLHAHGSAIIATTAIAASGTLTVLAALLVGARPFLHAPSDAAVTARDPSWRQFVPPAILAVLGLVAGLAPGLYAQPLVSSMMMSIDGLAEPAKADLSPLKLLWPVTTATVLSFVALGVGTALYLCRDAYRKTGAPGSLLGRVGPERGYALALAGMLGLARLQTRLLQNGSLRSYVRVTLLTFVAIGGLALMRTEIARSLVPTLEMVSPLDATLVAVLFVGAVAATMQRGALASVAVLGGVGFTIALLFAVYGAPDVAMTMFAVETLVVIIFVLVIFHLPKYSSLTTTWQRLIDAGCSMLFGVLMAGLALLALKVDAPPSVSDIHTDLSVTKAYGRNIVNVILVDFRAMDTLGEIFVIGVAAIGVYTLLRLRAPSRSDQGDDAAAADAGTPEGNA